MKYNTTLSKLFLQSTLSKKLTLTLFGVILVLASYAQTNITSTAAGGPWNSTTTWVGGVVPTQGGNDNAIIAPGATVTVTAAASCVNLTINGNLTMNNSGFTLSIGNPGSNTGSLTLNAGSNFFIGSANTVEFLATQTGPGITNNGGTIASSGVNGSDGGTIQTDASSGGGFFLSGNATTFYNFKFIQNATFNTTGISAWTVNGTFTIPNNNWGWVGGSKSPIYGAASTLSINTTQAYNINGGNFGGQHYEWASTAGATIGVTPGYPNNVTISSSTCCTSAGAGVANING
ncbi:MAG TPA: hypothetical protein VK890_09460, partial [Bacteroidia bacterium]|nr:hypothetical protein [Bacteroidia bacterium]